MSRDRWIERLARFAAAAALDQPDGARLAREITEQTLRSAAARVGRISARRSREHWLLRLGLGFALARLHDPAPFPTASHRMILALRDGAGLEVEDIAMVMGITEAAVRERLIEARLQGAGGDRVGCGQEERLASVVEGMVFGRERAELLDHAATCAACSGALRAVTRDREERGRRAAAAAPVEAAREVWAACWPAEDPAWSENAPVQLAPLLLLVAAVGILLALLGWWLL